MRYTAAVIGLGNIGQGYDYGISDASRVMTHASAFHHHAGFDLIAGVDPDAAARRRFEERYKAQSFASVSELYRAQAPHVVSVCVPTEVHPIVFRDVVERNPKAILCEKPLAPTVEEAQIMVESAERNGVLLLVNYIRRFQPALASLKRRVESGEFGKFYKGVQWYSRGILNNGSHFVDMLSMLFGEVTHVEVLQSGRTFGAFDCEPDVRVRFGNLEMYFLAARSDCFSLFDLQLLAEGAEIDFNAGGETIVIRKAVAHPYSAGQRTLEHGKENLATDLARYQWYVAEALYESLQLGTQVISNGRTALTAMRAIEAMMTRGAEVTHA